MLLTLLLGRPSAVAADAAAPAIRLRIAWGGGAARQWQGVLSLSGGEIARPKPLGVEADEPGSMWIDCGKLLVRERSVRTYDGVDVDIHAPLDATLTISLSAVGLATQPTPLNLSLRDLVSESPSVPLDDAGNRLLVRRSPGDAVRVRYDRDSLVFSPGEPFPIALQPHLLPVEAGTTVHLKAELRAARTTDAIWSQEYTLTTQAAPDESPSVDCQLKLPDREGAYDLVVEVTQRGLWKWNRPWHKPLAQRTVQVVVVADKPGSAASDGAPWAPIVELDPANPRWWERLRLKRIPGLQQGPLGSGNAQTWQHPLGPVIQLGPGGRGADISWEAYSLPVSQPGRPHILEIEFPSDVPQTLGISIVEPNAAGMITPIGLDSGFYTPDEAAGTKPRWLRHRLLFWPRTESPLVVLTNRRDGTRAAYGKLRLHAGPTQIVRPKHRTSQRWLAASMSRPLFPENFSATEAVDAWSGRSLDDWQTFYEGGSRLIEHLHHAGNNAMLLTVLADGSTIYPSQLLDPTPRYDTGTFLDLGHDPQRKDVLELVLRLFDREELVLVPGLHFSAPLPALEATLRTDAAGAVGIELLDGAGQRRWNQSSSGAETTAYNLLDPRVQEAMLDVVRELVARCKAHPSFAGLAIELSADGYTLLPGEDCGFDDATVARFERETKVRVPGSGPGRFAERAAFLTGPQRTVWLQWRASVVASFYQRVQKELAAARSDARLILSPSTLLEPARAERQIRPALARRTRFDQVLLSMGIQGERFNGATGIVLLRPNRYSPPAPIATLGSELQANRSSELDQVFAGGTVVGSLFYHPTQKARLQSFEEKSPVGKAKTYFWMASQFSPSGDLNRQRFAHSLATLDPQMMFDGGWLLAVGQEEALRPFTQLYRRLPSERFETVVGAARPVVVRYLRTDLGTYVYLVNDSASPVIATLPLQLPAGCTMEDLSGDRELPPVTGGAWTVPLEAYDVVGVLLSSSDVRIDAPRYEWPPESQETLEQQVRDLSGRIAAVANTQPVPLENAGFESQAIESNIAGWSVERRDGVELSLDQAAPHGGTSNLRLTSRGEVASLRSEPIAAPTTGRLEISVFARTSSANLPPLRMAAEAMLDGRAYYKYGVINPVGAKPVSREWSEYLFRINDLPAEGLSNLRVRFDLMGAGEVHFDDVQVFDRRFQHHEHIELTKVVASAHSHLQAGDLGECLYLLDGYWPRYLQSNVPLTQLPVAEPTRPKPIDEQEATAEKPGMLDRIRGIWKR